MTLRTRFAIIFLSMSLLLLASGHAMATLGVPIYWVEGGPDGRLGVVDFDGSGFQVLFSVSAIRLESTSIPTTGTLLDGGLPWKKSAEPISTVQTPSTS